MKHKNTAFTLVELIVVITILAILGTIAFISMQGYSKTSRDSIRISDANNIKKVLELYHLNAGKYPLPDEYGVLTYSGSYLFYQGYFGDKVVKNVSRNMNKVPTDPLTEKEYIYSVSNNKNELEILILLEGEDISLNTIGKTNAARITVTPKITGNYNGVRILTPTHIVPLPSIINTEVDEGLVEEITQEKIESMVINYGVNIPYGQGNIKSNTGALKDLVLTGALNNLDEDSTEGQKAAVIEVIKSAYVAESALNNNGAINYILSLEEDNTILAKAFDTIILNGTITSTISSVPTIIPVNGTCGSASKAYTYSDTDFGLDTYCGEGSVTGGGSPIFPTEGGNTTWTCYGLNGGTISSQCEATRTNTPINGVCGTSNGIPTITQPSSNQCTTGNLDSLTTNTSNYTWNCNGINGGSNATNCSASRQYIVTFNGNNGTGHSPTTLNITYNSSLGILPSNPTRTGYTFNGWYTQTSGGSQINTGTVITSAATFYAQWNINNYTVTFNGNNGTGHSPTTKSIAYNASVGTLPSNPTRTGYTFNGWYTQASGGSQINTGTVITSATTFYAQWTENPYCNTTLPSCNGSTCTLTYNPNSINQGWSKDVGNCGFSCINGSSGPNCEIACELNGIGGICPGGIIYAGSYNGFHYVTTPGNCTDSTTPTCSGGTDNVIKSWNNGTTNFTTVSGSDSHSNGKQNTIDLINTNDSGSIYQAAKYCYDMQYGGYNDWFLPSHSEIDLLYNNRGIIGFVPSTSLYWTSTETTIEEAYALNINNGGKYFSNKNVGVNVRCMRKLY